MDAELETPEAIRERMRAAAQASGLTLEVIGVKMGYARGGARQAVSRLLSTPDYDPRLSTLLALAKAIGCRFKDFL